MNEQIWSSEFPKEKGWYWCYWDKWSVCGFGGKGRKLALIRVDVIDVYGKKEIHYQDDGELNVSFITKEEGLLWLPLEKPKLPKQ